MMPRQMAHSPLVNHTHRHRIDQPGRNLATSKTVLKPSLLTRSVFDRYTIVNETDIRNACELVSKAHEEMEEVVEQSQSGDSLLNLVTK